MREVGAEIRRLRHRRGWTGAQLAVYANMAPSAISQIETGRRSANSGSLEKIAKALEVEVADLFPLEQPRLPELGPPGEAYFVPLEEGEEPDTVTLRLYTVRLMDERDRLLQEVRRLEREKAAMRQELEKSRRTRE